MRLIGALIALSVLGGAPLTAVRRRCVAGMSSNSEGAGLLIETPSLIVFLTLRFLPQPRPGCRPTAP